MRNERQLDEQMPAVKIMRKWRTNAQFAKAIGRAPSTTDRYIVNGHFCGADVATIHRDIMAAARRDSIKIEPEDFLDMRIFAEPEAVAA